MEFHHSLSKALLFPVEVALCHLVDIIANALKLVCSGESEVIPKIDEGPGTGLALIIISIRWLLKMKLRIFLKKWLECFFLNNLIGRLRLNNISYSVIAGYR